MSIKNNLRRILRKVGFDICHFTPSQHPIARRKKIIEYNEIDTVIDIGANAGQFAQQLRNEVDYKNKILSFEPQSTAFDLLSANATGDSKWEVFNYALGDTEEKKEINIAANSLSSSLLGMLPTHLQSAPESKYIGKEMISIKTLDSLFGVLCNPNDNVYLKIDTQGYESRVLNGAEKSLEHINIVQLEMSLLPLYEGEMVYNDMCMLMKEKGYNLIGIEIVSTNRLTGQLLQVDGIFQAFGTR